MHQSHLIGHRIDGFTKMPQCPVCFDTLINNDPDVKDDAATVDHFNKNHPAPEGNEWVYRTVRPFEDPLTEFYVVHTKRKQPKANDRLLLKNLTDWRQTLTQRPDLWPRQAEARA